MAGPTGLEPATSGVTGLRSNQLNYDPVSKELPSRADANYTQPRSGRKRGRSERVSDAEAEGAGVLGRLPVEAEAVLETEGAHGSEVVEAETGAQPAVGELQV